MSVWGAIGGWATAVVAIYGLFLTADTKLRPKARVGLSDWLRGKKHLEEPWAVLFVGIFDSLFRVRWLQISKVEIPFPGILRSAAASILAVTFVALVWVSILPLNMSLGIVDAVPPNAFIQYDLTFFISGQEIDRVPIDLLIGSPLLINFIPDYPGFPRWILPVADDGSTKGVPAQIRP